MVAFRTKLEATEADLSWYLLFSMADCGVKSNFLAMINAAIWPNSKWQDNYNESIFEAVNKRRQIEHRLQNISERHRNILYTSFGNEAIPATVVKYFNRYAPAALHSKIIVPEELIRLCNQFYMNQCSNDQKLLLETIKNDAMRDWTEAIDQYYIQRKKK